MATFTTTRTTSFRLTDGAHLGRVHLYRADRRIDLAWKGLTEEWRNRPGAARNRWLPHRSLRVALQVMSGDLVRLEPGRERPTDAFIVARQPLDTHALGRAMVAWEQAALGRYDRPVSGLIHRLAHERLDVTELIERHPGRSPTTPPGVKWVWEVALWDIAHRVCAQPVAIDDGDVPFRLDSDGTLVSWGRLVRPTRNPQVAAAMHQLTLHLITIPGVEEPLVSVKASIARLAPAWKASKGSRVAWAELDPGSLLLRASVGRERPDGVWRSLWADRAAEVLDLAHLHPLPDPEESLSLDGPVRTAYRTAPTFHQIGRGPGPVFHEYLAHHLHRVLGVTACGLELRRSRPSWPSGDNLAPRLPVDSIRTNEPPTWLHLLYATPDTRARLGRAVAQVLADPPSTAGPDQIHPAAAALADAFVRLPDGESLRAGPVEIEFLRPPDGRQRLLSLSTADELHQWIPRLSAAIAARDGRHAALIETFPADTEGDERERSQLDPKPELRSDLARMGIVSQFLRLERQEPGRRRQIQTGDTQDHAAVNAVTDLLRSAGIFLHVFPAHGLETGTLVVGIFARRWTTKTTGRGSYTVVNMVAAELGSNRAWGYVEREGWLDLHAATASFLATDHREGAATVRQRVERAVSQIPGRFGERPVVLAFDARQCCTLWPSLANGSDTPLEPWMLSGGTAVARIRTEERHVPRPAGTGPWLQGIQPAKYASFRPTEVVGAQGIAPMYLILGSSSMGRTMSLRKHSRFTIDDRGLRDDWHSLGVTEILVLDPGRLDRAAVTDQLAVLCRVAPSWGGVLRLPSPLHLSQATVADHPHEAALSVEPSQGDEEGDDW